MKRTLWVILGVILLIASITGLTWRSDLPAVELMMKYTTPNSGWMMTGGQNIHFTDAGTGQAILLIHGTGSSLHTWDGWNQMLAGPYRVVRLDLPGFGLSGPQPQGDYSREMYLTLFEDLRKALDIDRWTVVGNSFGGRLAGYYASDHPEVVSGLVLVNASGWPKTESSWNIFDLAKGPAGSLISHCTPKFLIERTLHNVYANDSLVSQDLIDRHYELLLFPGNRDALRDRLLEDYPDWTPETVTSITCPTLFLWGTEDPWFPESDARAWFNAMPNATFKAIPNAGHLPMEEVPVRTVAQFQPWHQMAIAP
ncbi:MAG: alpha/beta hydrolase [Flavobacteriales bacterium]|nr:alpha/beta hydrolase [Flavobacteriales bacterium]